MADDRTISKTLSYWLRHRPDEAGLVLDEAGWASVDAVLAALATNGLDGRVDTLAAVVAGSDKGRFKYSPDQSRLRARQGHSVPVTLDWPRAEPPALLYHGTVARFLPAIRADGLRPMKRHHVHLSPDRTTATAVGARRGEAVILTVRAGDMATAGYPFWLTGNGVWLADAVPPAFLVEPEER